jgi:hypothetical protein
MIAVDTSALMAILLDEADSEACIAVLERETTVFISAGTLAEALIVAERRGVAAEMALLVEGLGRGWRSCRSPRWSPRAWPRSTPGGARDATRQA